ncbi:transcriptional regulator GlxA family with amidase domain [Catalinimonas alkaloidigena]|uniref:DJ-1/PfpI family protein n=1 Tax=Catalinimonas alkaloidigena TaxID=1075417 RepID=UPI00240540C2|nr:DJ-1/PfpI family protein [Catalinimonas alkaloidigena]MDF9795974.1 transcriptional regulator GlxA family with amidase domain [Catalinimonas alkaloidigena]
MRTVYILIASLLCMCACSVEIKETHSGSIDAKQKVIKKGLPVIGLLMYEGVLTTEVTAPLDVFSKPSVEGEQLFNVITIAPTDAPILSEEGLVMQADFTFEKAPQLDVLFVPSAYDMHSLVRNEEILTFIKAQNQYTTYTVSNCAGAQLIGASGIADGKKIVTWIGGGKELQENYPALKVQDDLSVSYVEDGKFLSANGNLASYISSLELLEKLTDQSHRKFVESYLYLDRLQQWK